MPCQMMMMMMFSVPQPQSKTFKNFWECAVLAEMTSSCEIKSLTGVLCRVSLHLTVSSFLPKPVYFTMVGRAPAQVSSYSRLAIQCLFVHDLPCYLQESVLWVHEWPFPVHPLSTDFVLVVREEQRRGLPCPSEGTSCTLRATMRNRFFFRCTPCLCMCEPSHHQARRLGETHRSFSQLLCGQELS